MRTSKIIQLVLWSLVALLLIAFLCRGISGRASHSDWKWWEFADNSFSSPQTVDYTGSFPSASVKKVEIQGISMDVDFTSSAADEIQVTGRTYGSNDYGGVDVTNDNGVIKVTQKLWNQPFHFFSFINTGYRLEIALPASYSGDITVNSTSGDVSFAGPGTFGTVAVQNISGNVSGSMASDAFTCRLTSGDIQLQRLAVRSYALESVSGDITCDGVTGNGRMDSVSGDINANIDSLSGPASMVSRSGDIQLQLASSVGAQIAASSVSGDIHADIPLQYSGANKNHAAGSVGASASSALEASSTSGDITIRRSH